MPSAMRRCLDCGTLTTLTRSRCMSCTAKRERGRVRPERPGGRAWQRVRDAVLERDGRICWLCGGPGANTGDHVVPIARGGAPLDPANVRAAHLACNMRRGVGERDE